MNDIASESSYSAPLKKLRRETPGAADEIWQRKTEFNETKEINESNKNDGIGNTVAKHYNELDDKGKKLRKESRIYYMRNFNNWIKSMLIQDYTDKIKLTRLQKPKIGGNNEQSAEGIRYMGENKAPNTVVDNEFNVLDLGCGKGGDLNKWSKAGVDHLTCVDIAETSIEQARNRYYQMKKINRNKIFDAKFSCRDCTKIRLLDVYPEKFYGTNPLKFNIVSSQFAFHYSFESEAQAEVMVRNAAECLRPGGYFIGTTVDAQVVWQRLKELNTPNASSGLSKTACIKFGNSVYSVDFDGSSSILSALKQDLKENYDGSKISGKIPDCIPKFGVKYNFKLHGVVDCPEFLVNFDALISIAERNGLTLIAKQGFENFFKTKRATKNGKDLLRKINAMELYPPYKGYALVGNDIDGNYMAAKTYLEQLRIARSNGIAQNYIVQPQMEPAFILDDSQHDEIRIGTMSKEEWDAITLYCVFAFKKKTENIEQIRNEERQRDEKALSRNKGAKSSIGIHATNILDGEKDKIFPEQKVFKPFGEFSDSVEKERKAQVEQQRKDMLMQKYSSRFEKEKSFSGPHKRVRSDKD